MKSKHLFLILAFSIFILSCDDDDSSRKVTFDLEEFRTNKVKWDNLNFENYSFQYLSDGFLYSHLQIEMKNGEINSVISLAEDGFHSGDTLTIDGLFEEIHNQYPANGRVDVNSDDGIYLKEIQVEYDDNYFFPIEVHYVLHIPIAIEVDGNFNKYIRNFSLVD